MKNIDFKKLLPHLVAILIFTGLSLTYFYPALKGYKVKQGDIEKHKSMAHEYKSHKEKYDEPALWSGNMFSGMPTYLTSAVRYDGNIIHYLNKAFKLWLPHPASTLFAYFLGFYILLLCLKINPWLSVLGAIAFAFSSYFIIIIEAGHTSKSYAIGYMAPILGGMILLLRGKLKLGFLLIAIFTAAQIYVNHLQISYYLIFVLFFVWVFQLFKFIKSKTIDVFLKRTGLIIIAGLLGILPNLGQLLITLEYSKVSTRGGSEITVTPPGQGDVSQNKRGLDKEYITQWSYGIDESWTLLSPNVKGGNSFPIIAKEQEVERLKKEDPRFFNILVEEYRSGNLIYGYFGNQPVVSGPVYLGIILVFLALLAVFFVRTKLVYALTSVTLLALLLSWGKNFMGLTEFFIDFIPGYNKFRAVSMILVIVELTVPLLAILFLDYLIKKQEEVKKQKKKLFTISGVFVLILLFFYSSPSTFVDLISDRENATLIQKAAANPNGSVNLEAALISYREDVVSSSIFYSLKFLALGLLFIGLFIFGKIKHNILIVGLSGTILFDLWSVDKEYLNNKENTNVSRNSPDRYARWMKPEKFSVPYNPSPSDELIFNTESQKNPKVQIDIQARTTELKRNNPRFDQRKLIDINYAELMEETHYRVLNVNARLDQDVRTPYFHKSLGGYHGAKIRRYQDLVDFYLGIEHYQLKQILSQGGEQMMMQYLPGMRLTNMLNAKYIVGPSKDGKTQESVYLNPYAKGNVWTVSNLKVVPNADSAITGLKKLNYNNTLIVEQDDLIEGINEGTNYQAESGGIELTNYNPNELKYQFNFKNKQLAVFSEVFYEKGWNAYINGQHVTHFRGNYILRAMELPAGQGELVFKFEPSSYSLGKILTWVSSILIVLLVGVFAYFEMKAKK